MTQGVTRWPPSPATNLDQLYRRAMPSAHTPAARHSALLIPGVPHQPPRVPPNALPPSCVLSQASPSQISTLPCLARKLPAISAVAQDNALLARHVTLLDMAAESIPIQAIDDTIARLRLVSVRAACLLQCS
jgi:hypothetical protein